MNAKQFLDAVGREKAEQVAIAAGTTMEYFCHIAYGNRRPSFELAERLVAASKNKMKLVPLLRSKSVKVTS